MKPQPHEVIFAEVMQAVAPKLGAVALAMVYQGTRQSIRALVGPKWTALVLDRESPKPTRCAYAWNPRPLRKSRHLCGSDGKGWSETEAAWQTYRLRGWWYQLSFDLLQAPSTLPWALTNPHLRSNFEAETASRWPPVLHDDVREWHMARVLYRLRTKPHELIPTDVLREPPTWEEIILLREKRGLGP
jgi:hypothetical protein